MKKLNIKIVKCHEDAIIPEYKTKGAAACDLHSVEEITIRPFERRDVATGLKMEIPEGYLASIRPRSGLSLNSSLLVANSPGTLDSDYRGEVKVILLNNFDRGVFVKKGERIAQLLFEKVIQGEFTEVTELSETERGEGGFGSTGK